MCGGTGAIQPATEEIQNMVDEVGSYCVFYWQLETYKSNFF